MADTKISALPSATTPLAGTETLPVVQSSTTRQVSVANLTAGRAISASGVTVTGLTASRPVFTDGSSNLTSSGTVPTNQGGTGLTSFTQFGVFYASSTSAVAQTTNLKWQSSSLAINAGANAPGYNLEVVGTARWADAFAANGYEIAPGSPNIITSYNRTTGTWLTLRQRANAHEFYVAGALAWTMDTNNNIVQAVASKGVNFTANTPAAGMTSQLLNWYEEGTWTPTMTSASGVTTVNSSSGLYTRTGRCVFVEWFVNYTTDASVGTSTFTFGGLPFTCNASQTARGFVALSNWTGADYNDGVIYVNSSATTMTWASRAVNQSSRTNAQLYFSASYFV